MNALSNNLIMVDRKKLKNPNGLILGTPGSGKSFSAKREICNAFLVTDDDIIICDPEAEYAPLVERLHGQVIHISPASTQYINPMDINSNYSEEDNPLALKADFILSLCELVVGGKEGLQPVEKTVIDRCVHVVYRKYFENPTPENMPLLEDLYNALLTQDEPEARHVAAALEIYVKGSLNIFNHHTNVDIHNRIVCFDIKQLGKQLKKLGMLIVQDAVWGRVTANRSAGKSTRYYADEFHLLLKEEQTAAYSVEIWKRFRKWGGIPTALTQNVKDLLASPEVSNIFENSDFVYMLNQANGDRQILAKQLNISPHQLSYNAALCRERADWMVGINASRLFSCLYGQPLAVGRVMTPVLAMTVVREAAIAAFTPEKFYTVDLELTSGCTASSRRIPEKNVAENLLEACRKEMVATIQRITRKEKSENPPPLYDLTTLQRDANRLLGYSAQQTLDYVQSLYEKKLTTYPRTDSCYITDDDEEMLEELTEELEGFLDITPEDVDEAVPRTRRTVNREKVTDHHAILPTRSMLQADLDALPKGEQNVLKLIIARTLMAVSKPFRYLETLLTTECAGEVFTAKGKEILEEGWKAVEHKVLADILNRKQELTALPNAAENECGILNAELKEGQTSPPKHFTEDTLLHAMETASADSMPEGVERQGIGTPATRAATIEKLVQKGFLERKGTKKTKVLLPTDKGKALITVMPEEIQSPELTADWETKLLQIERSEMEPSEFMTEINTMITELVKNTEMKKGVNALMKNKIIGVCPNCGANVVEREKGWFCENRECRFVLWKDNAFFKRLGKRLDAHVADKLLRDGRVRLKDCKSAKGKTYNATVLLGTEPDGRSKFSLEFEGGC